MVRRQESALAEVGGLSWGAFKPVLADAVIAHLAPLQQRYADVMAEPGYLDQVRLAAYTVCGRLGASCGECFKFTC